MTQAGNLNTSRVVGLLSTGQTYHVLCSFYYEIEVAALACIELAALNKSGSIFVYWLVIQGCINA